MKSFDLRTWLFPSVCFLFFVYGMAFLFVYTYNDSFGRDFSAQKKTSKTIDPDAIRNEIKKIAH